VQQPKMPASVAARHSRKRETPPEQGKKGRGLGTLSGRTKRLSLVEGSIRKTQWTRQRFLMEHFLLFRPPAFCEAAIAASRVSA
jgi:hypothetical protein